MKEDNLRNALILIVDDEQANIDLLEAILSFDGYTRLVSTRDSRRVLDLFQSLEPDLVLLDLHMPHLDGFAVMQQLREHIPSDDYVPILILTADITREAKERALSGGARDFLTKPIDETETLLRIRNLLTIRALQQQVLEHNLQLEERVRIRTSELDQARIDTLDRLAKAAEYRDDATGDHIRRVGELAAGRRIVVVCESGSCSRTPLHADLEARSAELRDGLGDERDALLALSRLPRDRHSHAVANSTERR